MADEDLLIGGQGEQTSGAQGSGSSGLATPMEFVNVSVFGEFKDGSGHVEQPYSIQRPKGTSEEDTSLFIWKVKFLPQAALIATGSAGEVNFYPLDMFKRFAVKISTVIGVTV